MTNEEKNKFVKKESKSLWRVRAFILIFLVVVILIIIVVVQKVSFRARQIGCAIQLKCLQSAFWGYMNDYDEKLLTTNNWNDLMIEHADVVEAIFHCLGSESSGKTSDYAINLNLYGNEMSASGDTIFLFECNPGWNQTGSSEIFNAMNHYGKGGNYTSCGNPEGRFIKLEAVESLKWKP